MCTKINCEIFIRTIFFNILMFSTLFFAFFVCYPIVFLPSKIVRYYWFYPVASILSFIIEKVAGIKCHVDGRERLKCKNVIYASRHESMWETIYLVFLIKNGIFILKKELTDIPLFGHFLKKVGMISIDRSSGIKSITKIVKEAKIALDKGNSVVIFPEGTRSAPSANFEPKGGIALMYEKLNVSVIPIAINSGDFWGRRSFFKFPGTVLVKLLPAIEPGLNKHDFVNKLTEVINHAEKEIHN